MIRIPSNKTERSRREEEAEAVTRLAEEEEAEAEDSGSAGDLPAAASSPVGDDAEGEVGRRGEEVAVGGGEVMAEETTTSRPESAAH